MKPIRYAVILAMLCIVPAVYAALNNQTPFQLKVIDENGRAVPYVQVSTDNGIICYARDNGTVSWTESSLMNRRVRFSVDTPGYHVADGKIFVIHGRHAELRVSHSQS